jgi:YggT family protein
MILMVLFTLIKIYEVLIIIRVLFSWIQLDPDSQIVQWVYRLTEPVLYPIRKILPGSGLGIDFSPLVVLLLIELLKRLLATSLNGF